MQLQLQSFSTLVQNMAAAVQSAAAQLLDLTTGSTLRALLEASASVGLWMQWLILLVLQTTRAATSAGPDLDTWMADFGVARLPAVPATGIVTFSRFTATAAVLVPTGSMVRTADGTQTFAVSSNPANPAWSAAQGGYVIAAGNPSLDLPVSAAAAGTAGNIQAGAVALLVTALPGIDTVTNTAPFQSGLDAEADTALRARFQSFIDSRSRATPTAIGFAISGIQQGLDWTIAENTDPSGNAMMGSFVVTVDDGSGQPSAGLLGLVTTAVDAVRPVGTIFAVQPPALTIANLSLAITVDGSVAKLQAAGQVGAALAAYVNALRIGAPLPLSRLAQVAYAASPAVANVTAVLVNAAPDDLVPGPSGLVRCGSVAVN